MIKFISCIILFIAFFNNQSMAQAPQNWDSSQLTQPAALAATLKNNRNLPVIFCVGPGAVLPTSVDIGMVKNEDNLEKFKTSLSTLPRTTNIIIYCGCCPFDHCPNVRPAIELLQNMKFTNYHLLNLPQNKKTDWINKGYPVVK